jgi:hypothetical protein
MNAPKAFAQVSQSKKKPETTTPIVCMQVLFHRDTPN